ncbi:GNAT family N-acetyltransferase [Granulicella rosea]|nr:GNAT family N-acetyltransferase [Granulicella rosea]
MDDAYMLSLIGAATFMEAFAGRLEGSAIRAHCARAYTLGATEDLLSKETTKAWVATVEPDAAPVGFVLLTEPDLPLPGLTGADIELKRIYLFTRFHGNGNGQRMMDQAIGGARAQGKSRLLLGVYSENPRALAFYAKNGFVQVGTREFALGTIVHHDYILARPI